MVRTRILRNGMEKMLWLKKKGKKKKKSFKGYF